MPSSNEFPASAPGSLLDLSLSPREAYAGSCGLPDPQKTGPVPNFGEAGFPNFGEAGFSGFYAMPRYSNDQGLTWSTNQIGNRLQLSAFQEGNGVVYAVGRDRDDIVDDEEGADIDLISVDDGLNWTTMDPGSLDDRNGLIFFANTFISVGDSGTIRQSGAILPPDSFTNWIADYHSGGDAAIDANPDGDWASNFIEYALGTNPDSLASSPTKPAGMLDGSGHLHVDVSRAQIRDDIQYIVEWADSLAGPWNTTALTVLENSETMLRVRTDRTTADATRLYLRFRAAP